MVCADDEEGGETAAQALASLRKATKELNELADFCEQNYRDEPATGLNLRPTSHRMSMTGKVCKRFGE